MGRPPGRTRKGSSGPSSSAQPGSALSDCTLLYAAAISDPFGAPVGACIPDGDVRDSFRTKVWARGTAVADALGNAWVTVNANAAITNDLVSVAATDGTGAFAALASSGVGVAVQSTNSLFASTTFGTDVSLGLNPKAGFRPVSWGLRWRPTSAELNLQGTQIGYTAGGDLTSLENLNYNNLLSIQEVEEFTVDSQRRWFTVRGTSFMDSANSDAPGDYVSTFLAATATDVGRLQSCLMFLGAPGTVATFEYEFVAHFEVDGPIPGKAPSHCDPIGLAVANAQTAKPEFRAARYVPDKPTKAFVSMMYDHLSSGISGLIARADRKSVV